MAVLEEAQNKPYAPTCFEAIISRPESNGRHEKLEYFSSEEERKRRINQVCIIQPSVNPDNLQSTEHLKEVLALVLENSGREIF